MIAPNEMPCSAASHLRLYYLPVSHKKDSSLKLVNMKLVIYLENYLSPKQITTPLDILSGFFATKCILTSKKRLIENVA